ncbi:MAG: tetratricopeptide repeat protein [Nitrospirae bacterium]|nr:tetratricopeptide repeat protein [Nitrospirota bacterium]
MLKKEKTLLILLFLLCTVLHAPLLNAESSDTPKLTVALFPFNDMDSQTLDKGIPLILKAALSGYEFLEIVPVETITTRLYEVEPSFLWTGKDAGQKKGGILWTIRPVLIEEVNKSVSADYSIYGDVARAGSRWNFDVRLMEGNDTCSQRSFPVSGLSDDEIRKGLSETASLIANLLKGESAVNEAEEYVRRFMGGTYTYPVVLEKIKGLVYSFPDSVPLRALLLDLYLKQKIQNQDEVLLEGLKIISLYNPGKGDDTRYLLSLNLDPFDATAGSYEIKQDWEKAISMRNDALKLFQYKTGKHKNAIGRDYYMSGLSLKKEGQKAKALEDFSAALTYLESSSEYYSKAAEEVRQLRNASQ